MNNLNFLTNDVILTDENPLPTEVTSQPVETSQTTEVPAGEVDAAATGVSYGWGGVILMYVAIFAAMYFFFIRPQRKREKEIKEKQSSLQLNDEIITQSGMYGKIVDIGADVFVIEFGTNKGVRVPVRKTECYPSPGYNMSQVTVEETK